MRRFVIAGLLVSLLIAGIVAHFASPHPDGLEKTMEDHAVEPSSGPLVNGVFPDYEFPLLGSATGKTIAGLAGTAAVFVLLVLVLKVFLRSGPAEQPASPERPDSPQTPLGETSR